MSSGVKSLVTPTGSRNGLPASARAAMATPTNSTVLSMLAGQFQAEFSDALEKTSNLSVACDGRV